MDKLIMGALGAFCYAAGFLASAMWFEHIGLTAFWIALGMLVAVQAAAYWLHHATHKRFMADMDGLDLRVKAMHVVLVRDLDALGISHDGASEPRVLQ